MSQTLVLYWLPIFLGAALGSRQVARRDGIRLGVVCALLWVGVVQANSQVWLWEAAVLALCTIVGAVAIVLIGMHGESDRGVPGETDRDQSNRSADRRRSRAADRSQPRSSETVSAFGFAREAMTAAFRQYDAWLEVHRFDDDPWADFDEFVRSVIFQWVRGMHVRTYRVLSEGDELIPLREMDIVDPAEMVSARRGVEGYVATTGRSYVAGDSSQGPLVAQLAPEAGGSDAERGDTAPAWCFAIIRGSRKIGVVRIGRFGDGTAESGGEDSPLGTCGGLVWSRAHLRLVELVISQFWMTLAEVCRSRAAVITDSNSGGLTRRAFFEVGRELLADAYRQGEPVVVAVIGMEGLRRLDDEGKWEAVDDIRATISRELLQRMRAEDRLGRFDDSRFVLLLRRVDSELGTLISNELMNRLSAVLQGRAAHYGPVELRCGLAGSGVTGGTNAPGRNPDDSVRKPSLAELVTAAVSACSQARRESTRITSDLRPAAKS